MVNICSFIVYFGVYNNSSKPSTFFIVISTDMITLSPCLYHKRIASLPQHNCVSAPPSHSSVQIGERGGVPYPNSEVQSRRTNSVSRNVFPGSQQTLESASGLRDPLSSDSVTATASATRLDGPWIPADNVQTESAENSTENEDSLYFQSIMPSFCRLTRQRRELAKIKISQILYELEYGTSADL